jgi:acetylornithine deacetylase/succinyl-diaminopimelate desuccinylase-like protein
MPLLAQSVAELAATPSIRAAMEWFRRERAWINLQHLKLCRVPAPTFFEQKRAQWMAEQFRSLGWEARIDRAGNVIASLPNGSPNASQGRDRPAVAVTAHLDTVLAPRSPDDIKVSGDGRLSGPGVSDNGAGLAALLALAAVWSASSPLKDAPLVPLLIANVGEEGEGNLSGMRYLCRAAAGGRPSRDSRPSKDSRGGDIRAFLVLDGPSVDHITWQALASRRFDITFTGPGGHSWSDYGTGNPVHALSRAVTLFADEVQAAPNGTPIGASAGTGNIPRSSFNFGVIEGGTSINSIPSEARAKVDLRSESPERLEGMAALLGSAVERAVEMENARGAGRAPRAGNAGANASGHVVGRVKEIGSRPGGGLQEGAPLLECMRAVDAHLGIKSYLDCSSTDANVPLSLGLPAVSIGAGGQGGGAHTTSEWFQPEKRELGLQRVLLALCMLLAGD